MWEAIIYFIVIACVCLGLIVLDDRITEAPGDRRWDHLESALGRGKRFTVSVLGGGAHAYRVEYGGVVYGFPTWVACEEFMWRVNRGWLPDKAKRECCGVLLSHPSLGLGGR